MAITLQDSLFRIVAPFYPETFEKFSRSNERQTVRLYVIPFEYGRERRWKKENGMVSRITSVFQILYISISSFSMGYFNSPETVYLYTFFTFSSTIIHRSKEDLIEHNLPRNEIFRVIFLSFFFLLNPRVIDYPSVVVQGKEKLVAQSSQGPPNNSTSNGSTRWEN